ncbi:unnamed protein product, partial [marine sediment metagenome]
VSTGKLQVGSVTETIIGDGEISTQKIKANAITADEIAAGAVTAEQVSTNEIIANAANIKNAIITGAKIKNAEVDTLQIKGNAVTIPVHTYVAESSFFTHDTWVDVLPTNIISEGGAITIIARIWLMSIIDTTLHCHFRKSTTNLEENTIQLKEDEWQLVEFFYRDTPGAG